MSTLAIRFRSAMKDPMLVGALVAAFVVFWADIGILLWKLPTAAGEFDILALHYNVFFGVDRTGPWRMALIMPGIGAFVLLLNGAFAVRLHAEERFVARFFGVTALLVNVILFFAALFIIIANLPAAVVS